MKLSKAINLSCLALAIIFSPLALSQVTDAPTRGSDDQAEHRFGFDHGNVLEIVTREATSPGAMEGNLEFALSRDEIPAGWTTIRHINATEETHSIFLTRVPEAQAELTREQFQAEVTQPFQEAWNSYFGGQQTVSEFQGAVEASRPEWFGDAQPIGGPGLLGGQQTGWTTVNLDPGTYFVESRTLDEQGTFGAGRGLVERLVVTERDPGMPEATEPEADIQVRLSSTEGMRVEQENIQPGPATIEVIFEDNIDHGGFGLDQGHDLQLIRLDEGTTIEQLQDWMDFVDADEGGFYRGRQAMVSTPDARGPQTFRGGVGPTLALQQPGQQEQFPQSTFMHVNLTPGRYALVSRTPNPGQPFEANPEASLLQEFSVTPWLGLAGAWHDPETDGQGWNFISGPEGMIAFFYGYNDAGDNIWLVSDQINGDIAAGEELTADLQSGTGLGGTFETPVAPGELTNWGQVTFTFENCDEGTAELSGTDGTSSQQLRRISPLMGQFDCGLNGADENGDDDDDDNGTPGG